MRSLRQDLLRTREIPPSQHQQDKTLKDSMSIAKNFIAAAITACLPLWAGLVDVLSFGAVALAKMVALRSGTDAAMGRRSGSGTSAKWSMARAIPG